MCHPYNYMVNVDGADVRRVISLHKANNQKMIRDVNHS